MLEILSNKETKLLKLTVKQAFNTQGQLADGTYTGINFRVGYYEFEEDTQGCIIIKGSNVKKAAIDDALKAGWCYEGVPRSEDTTPPAPPAPPAGSTEPPPAPPAGSTEPPKDPFGKPVEPAANPFGN